ncbi:MAG: hypothetical protein HWN65_07060 [Candidatus Helarchaeota archaeon]|nr:hypothetical protein [Candidatus Helarchaeota archaeon]
MQKNNVDKKTKEAILRKVQREFPGCRALQDIHYYRYIKEIEWHNMSHNEIVENIKKGAREIKKEIDMSLSS